MTKSEFEDFKKNLLESGSVKQTGLFVFDALNNFQLDDDNKFLIDSILELYLDYIKSLDFLLEYKFPFLKSLKGEEIKRNQVLESVSPFLVQVFMNSNHKSATNFAIKHKKENKDCSVKQLCQYHKILLNGLSPSIEETSQYRNENDTIVGECFYSNDGNLVSINSVSYIPIDYRNIKIALELILNLYNDKTLLDKKDIFVNPILIHGLLSSLQCFRDGNSRLARVLEHVRLWELTNKMLSIDSLELPVLYSSDGIIRLNKQNEYRKHIKEFAINPSNATFNEWIKFNMFIFEKQIYYNQDRINDSMLVLKKYKK